MTEKEAAFLERALDSANGKDGNFDFACPFCGGYSIGTRKNTFGVIMASCHNCHIFINTKIILQKGA